MVRGQAAWGRLGAASMTVERRNTSADQHNNIVQAVAERNADLAERYMRDQSKTVQSNLLRITNDLNPDTLAQRTNA